MRRIVFASVSATALLLAGCVAPSQPPVRPAPPVAVPTPAPAPAPAPPPASADWRDWSYTPGTWSYSGGIASFGLPGQPAELTLRCDSGRGRILLSRRSLGGAPNLTIRTTSVARTLAATASANALVADLGARDTLIDALGYSRGRFVVEGGAMPALVVPSWAEILRVAEDCRG